MTSLTPEGTRALAEQTRALAPYTRETNQFGWADEVVTANPTIFRRAVRKEGKRGLAKLVP